MSSYDTSMKVLFTMGMKVWKRNVETPLGDDYNTPSHFFQGSIVRGIVIRKLTWNKSIVQV